MRLFQYRSLLDIVTCPFAAHAGVKSGVQRSREGPQGERRGLSPAHGALGGCKAKLRQVSAPHWSWGPAQDTAGPLGTRTSVGPTLSLGHACTERCHPQREPQGHTQPVRASRVSAAGVRVCPLPSAPSCPSPAAWTGKMEEEAALWRRAQLPAQHSEVHGREMA